LVVTGRLRLAALAPLGERLPQRRHHCDGGREDAVDAVRSEPLEKYFGAVLGGWHDVLLRVTGLPEQYPGAQSSATRGARDGPMSTRHARKQALATCPTPKVLSRC